jgi:hypothetical protein
MVLFLFMGKNPIIDETGPRGKHCRHPIAVMRVVDTFGPDLIGVHMKKKWSMIGNKVFRDHFSDTRVAFGEEFSVGCVQDLVREQGFCHQTIKSFQTCETFQESHKNLRGFVSI